MQEFRFGDPGQLVTVVSGRVIALQFDPKELEAAEPGRRLEAEVIKVLALFPTQD